MLKQLKLQLELKQKRARLSELDSLTKKFQERQNDLEKALEEAQSDEDFKLIDEQIEALQNEVTEAGAAAEQEMLQGEVAEIENQLTELEEREQHTQEKEVKKPGEREAKNMNKLQVRELLKTGQYYERAEVKQFYDELKERAVTGGELIVPNIIVNRIMDIAGDYGTIYTIVDRITVNGTSRILIDTDTTPATWMEQKAALPTGDAGTITHVDFDGFKVGKVVFVDNSLLQDSIINLDDYVTRKIARALALALDKAVLSGAGAASKEPEGITTDMEESQQADVELNANLLKSLVKKISLVDTGKDNIGPITVVLSRQTYYDRLVEYSVNVDSSGSVVGRLPNLNKPDLCGLPIVFNNFMDKDKILFGDFTKYTLVERESIILEKSEQVKFVEDQTAFRGKGRFDGKPTNKKAFALITLTEAAEALTNGGIE